MKRREFVNKATIIASGIVVAPSIALDEKSAKRQKEIGLQLYTVRDDMQKDVASTLSKISSIGYTHVEGTGYNHRKFYDLSPADFKMILKDCNLKMYSGHVSTGFKQARDSYNMANNWEAVCEDASFMGQKYVVCGYFDVNERKTIDDYKRFAGLFNKCGETAKKYGLTFCHHNHDFEFEAINNIIPYDILLNETDDGLVKFELDHYWTQKANVDGMKVINDHPGRFPLFHIKDMDATPERFFTEVGTGVIDWKPVFDASKTADMKYFYIEQDACRNMPALKSIEVSFNNLTKMQL
ncbi:MAG: sugar phosphate isomerase/epimerase [Saprospiraceae bacterium]